MKELTTLGPTFQPPNVIGDPPQVPKLEPQFRFDSTAKDRENFCKGLPKTDIPSPKEKFDHPHNLPENEAELKKLPPRDQAAFKKLKLAFEYLVCKTSELLAALNTKDANAYVLAQKAYTDFINNDLDGYGKHFKDRSIEALIGPDPNDSTRNIIIGARIQVMWNPHASSSGVPISSSGP